MKKLKILVLLISLLGLTACNKTELTIKEMSGAQCEHDDRPLNHKSEYNISFIPYKNIFKTNEELTITINGKEYTVVYDGSTRYFKVDYAYHKYYADNVCIEINKRTGTIISFYDNNPSEKLYQRDKDACLQAAIDFINNHNLGINLEQYELVYANDGDGLYNVYDFEWRGKIENVYTAANFKIRVSKVSDKVSFESEYLDMMEDITLPDSYDKETIDRMIDERLNDIYSEIKDTYTIKWRAKELQYLIKLKNGKMALICETTSYIEEKDKFILDSSDESEFIIFLE